jgi:hypothetical protein
MEILKKNSDSRTDIVHILACFEKIITENEPFERCRCDISNFKFYQLLFVNHTIK